MNPKDTILGRKYKKEFGNDMNNLINAGVNPSSIAQDSSVHPTIYNQSPLTCGNPQHPANCACDYSQYGGYGDGCTSCGTINKCDCEEKCDCIQTEKCCTSQTTLRTWQQASLLGTKGDQKLTGLGYKVFDFNTDYDNEAEIEFSTPSCGTHPLVFDCTKEPIHEDAFKTCTMNEVYFDPENCQYVNLYRFLGIPDPGDPDNPDIPAGNGGTDVFTKFLHPRYDLRIRLGLYETDINLEPIKRDAGRTIHACISELISNGTDDEITYSPTGSGGKMAEIDFYRLAQLLTYKDNDYADYGIVVDRPQSSRTKEPPISYYKVKLCPGDADILCLGETVVASELNGYMIYEARPNEANDVDGDGNFDWFYKLHFVLDNGREFWYYSSSDNLNSGCSNNSTVCIGDGENVLEQSSCGKALSGCSLSADPDVKEGYVHSGCLTIHGNYYSFSNTKTFPLGGENQMTMVWAELVTNSCGLSNIQFKSRTVNFKNIDEMSDFGDYLYSNRNDIIPIAAYQYVAPGTDSGAIVPINDYRSYLDLNEITYSQQYSSTAAVKEFEICFFGKKSKFNFNFQTSMTTGVTSHRNHTAKLIGGDVANKPAYSIHERGQLVGTGGNQTANNDPSTTKLNGTFGLGWGGGSGVTSMSGNCYFDTNQGIKLTSQSSGSNYLSAIYGVSTSYDTGDNEEINSIERINFNAVDNFDDVHIQSQGAIGGENPIPIFFVGIGKQD